jgi:hypothetical protein
MLNIVGLRLKYLGLINIILGINKTILGFN